MTRAKTITATQVRVLYVIDQHGGSWSWLEITEAVWRRSGRTVRPTAATWRSMRAAGWIEHSGTWVNITDAGRAVLGDWRP